MEIKYDAKAKKILIEVAYDADSAYEVSKSGKSQMVDSSGGFVAVPGAPAGKALRISLNVIAGLAK